jgi:hypothetical protein
LFFLSFPAGENIGSGEGFLAFTGRWTVRKKHDIMESRRRGTLLLGQALASLKQKPRVLVSASGVGFYGCRAEAAGRLLTEEDPKGSGFLADVADVWERSTDPAKAAGIRVVTLRFAPILSKDGGLVQKMYVPFNLCLGGPMGSGNQHLSWVTLPDAVRAIEHAIARPELEGAVNVAAPNPVTNAEFANKFAAALGRPATIPMPEETVKTVFGEMGEETILADQQVSSAKLQASGFRFLHTTVEEGIRAALQHI